MNVTSRTKVKRFSRFSATVLGAVAMTLGPAYTFAAGTPPNACPVDGCVVEIVEVGPSGEELAVTFESNFTPDVSKNHFHVWWAEKFTVEQVGRNAETVHGVTQGRWHRHDDYPVYITKGAASAGVREGAVTLCVSAADRNHNILDVKIFDCMDVSQQLQ